MSLDSALGEAPSRPIVTGFKGILYKKAGGKAFEKKRRVVDKWSKRWFVLPPGGTVLSYYRSEAEQQNGSAPLGAVECEGATVFLKEIKGGVHRFTVRSSVRELKLRAPGEAEYTRWIEALQPIMQFREDLEDSAWGDESIRDVDLADEDDDDDDDDGGASERISKLQVAGSGRGSGAHGPAGYRGYLEKKSGGKDGKAKAKLFEKWDKRWFVLPPNSSTLNYYKNEGEHNGGKEALGSFDVAGASYFLKEVKGTAHRFTVKNSERELKLRAVTAAEHEAWVGALKPYVTGGGAGADDDDSD